MISVTSPESSSCWKESRTADKPSVVTSCVVDVALAEMDVVAGFLLVVAPTVVCKVVEEPRGTKAVLSREELLGFLWLCPELSSAHTEKQG